MYFLIGWGDTSEGSQTGSAFLMEVDVPIIGMSQCQKSYSKGDLIRPVVKEQICAAYPNGGKDSCQVITVHLCEFILKTNS